MMSDNITRSTPAGCIIGFFGLLLLLAGLLCGYVGWRVHQAEAAHHPVDVGCSVGEFLAGGALLIAVGIAILWWGLRLISKIEAYDPSDPKGPAMKW